MVLNGIIQCATVLSNVHLLSELAYDMGAIFRPARFQVSQGNDVEGMRSQNFIAGQKPRLWGAKGDLQERGRERPRE
jgi:hypothetical protein